jgi:diacylglycerol kinase (ATP)
VNRPTKDDDIASEIKSEIKEKLPLDVLNNYFSIGADAKIALDFHHARRKLFFFKLKSFNTVLAKDYLYFQEKNPELFTSQAFNKIEYVKVSYF